MLKNKTVLKRVIGLVGKYKIFVFMSFLLAVVSVASQLYAPVLFGKAVDLIVGKDNVDFKSIGVIISKTLIMIGITALSQWFMNIINNRITYRVVKDVRVKAFRHLQNLEISYIDSHNYGDIVSRIINDVDQFSDGLLMGFTQLFTGITTIIGTLIFMFSVNIKISLIVRGYVPNLLQLPLN